MGLTRMVRSRLARPQGLPRRIARNLGIGWLLRRLGLVPLLRRTFRDRAVTSRDGADGSGNAPEESHRAPGVLLVGHPYGVLGVGEYLRASAAALAAADVPFHIRNAFDWGEHLRDKHTEFDLWDRLTSGRPHGVNVFHINADEMADARRHLGTAFLAGRYNIACWHWELSRFPEAWLPALQGVDELWASSRFIQHALAEKAPVPVVWMPHPMDVRGGAGLERCDLALPERTYLFLTSFDFTSFVTRKNPLGVVRAFRTAFPLERGEQVGLVIKTNGAAERPDDASAFLASPELKDLRIVVIDQMLDRRRLIGLFEQCDCFVSLHRSEGFGRGIAEAMLLGKPVIATGYSGNMDFTNPLDACIVDYQLVPVGPHEYPHATGQHWADPDLEQAAWYMRRLVSDPAWGAALADRGRELVEAQHGLLPVGQRYRARLEKLGFV